MFEKFIPDYIFNSLYDIPISFFIEKNIKAVIFDIDNTLVADGIPEPDDKTVGYIDQLKKHNIKLSIVSNNTEQRTRKFNEKLRLFYSFKSKKPLKSALKSSLSYFGKLEANKIVMIGDQILTDIFAAKRNGVIAILVKPITVEKTRFFKFKRWIEKPFIKKYYKLKGKDFDVRDQITSK